MALYKIIRFYFMRGEANMKELFDMELNVIAHAIARILGVLRGVIMGGVYYYTNSYDLCHRYWRKMGSQRS